MRKVSFGAAAALLAGSVLMIPVEPALAQEEPAFVQWQSPEDGARLSGPSVHIKAKVGFHGGVRGWAVEVMAPDGEAYPGWGTICEKSESRSPAYVNVDCVWDTTHYPEDAGPTQNQPYVVRIITQGTSSHSDERDVTVSNPVSAPRDVRLGFVDSTKQATIRWAPNPEPDIVSYVIQERVGDGPWKGVGQAGGKVTTFTRNLPAPGTYRYQVAALRSAGSGTDTLQSAWAAPAAEPKQIVVAEPKRPEPSTTTTQPPVSAEPGGEPGPPAGPGDPGAPVPVTAASPSPGDPAAPGAPAPAGGTDLSRNGAMVSPITPGAPGSVKSGGATVGGSTTPTGKPAKPKNEDEEAPEGPDTGYSTELPYEQAGESVEDDGDSVGRVLVGLPEAIGGDETRQLLVPLAAGLLLFVFAMHIFYVSRRAGQEAQVPLETE
jgi:hypothetical protein